jgi:hypothetical protein
MANTTILRCMKLKHTIFPQVEILSGRVIHQKIINFYKRQGGKDFIDYARGDSNCVLTIN